MEREHLEFGEALRTLANLTGRRRCPSGAIRQDEERRGACTPSSSGPRRSTQRRCSGHGGRAAGERTCSRRGLTEETLRSFGLGYAPAGNGCCAYLERRGLLASRSCRPPA